MPLLIHQEVICLTFKYLAPFGSNCSARRLTRQKKHWTFQQIGDINMYNLNNIMAVEFRNL